ncbi:MULTISPECIES: lipopolysaccharide assembly protein LapA domain-containing protein [Pseudomonas]|uniref:lipopolysaccharide assembly protein LapA domain-containing protein n=1 Tax=Pseudomonas TaxID=286 RepID=UPI0009BF0217|nr:lipopolysaccharide assembly protein LapA domain-containing protein [Pseudomonas putida]
MHKLKRALVALFILLLSAFVLLFVMENQQAVSIVILGWSMPAIPMAVLVLLVLVVGLVVGPVLGSCSMMLHRSRRRASAQDTTHSGG